MTRDAYLVKNRFGEEMVASVVYSGCEGVYPAILLVPGLGKDPIATKVIDDFSKLYVQAGFVSVQVSFAEFGLPSENYIDVTIERQARQIEDVLIWMKDYPCIDSERIGIHATSFGVLSTLLTNLFDTKAFIFVSGSYVPEKNIKQEFQTRNAYNPNGKSLLPHTNGSKSFVGPAFWRSLSSFHGDSVASFVSQPTMLVHGEKDEYVHTHDVEHFFRMLGSEQKKLLMLPDGDHGISQVSQETKNRFSSSAVEWFSRWV